MHKNNFTFEFRSSFQFWFSDGPIVMLIMIGDEDDGNGADDDNGQCDCIKDDDDGGDEKSAEKIPAWFDPLGARRHYKLENLK